MHTAIHQHVEDARLGRNPRVICRVSSGWVVLGEVQFLPGYSLLLPDPVVADLTALDAARRGAFLLDMSLIGEALLAVTEAHRINYEMLGNVEPALHAHVLPRYRDEPEALRTKPVWFYDWAAAAKFDAQRDRAIMDKIADYLANVGARVD